MINFSPAKKIFKITLPSIGIWAIGIFGVVIFGVFIQNYSVTYAKVPTKSVEPFFQEISAETPKIYQSKVTYLSPEKTAPLKFSSLGATWKQNLPDKTSISLEVRLKNNGKYSDWYPLEASIDEKDTHIDNSLASSFLTTSQADGYQYRISLNSDDDTLTPVLDNLKFTFINGGSPQQKTDLLAGANYSAANDLEQQGDNPLVTSTTLLAQAESPLILPKTIKLPPRTIRRPTTSSNLKIINRSEWGADESLRLYQAHNNEAEVKLVKFEDDYYSKFTNELKESKHINTNEKGDLLTWPLSYPESIKKIVIHHTATTKSLEDPKKAIRDIYIWHTLSKGWGDIGYNYIIDQQGNIYEGRFGGEMVVGAHAGRGNHGSIGIAVLGDFQNNDPPEAVVTALTALIKEKATFYNIDTEGSSLFRGESYPNIMGHRDIMSTSCPGDKLYAMLPIIRKLAKINNSSTSTSLSDKTYNFTWANHTPVFSTNPKSKKSLTLSLKNTGTKSWSPATYFQIRSNDSAKTFLKNSDQIMSSTVGKEIKPGQSIDLQMLTFSTGISGSTLIDIMPVINGKEKIPQYLSFGYQVKTPAPKLKYDYEVLSIIYNKTEFKKGDTVGVTIRLRNKGTSPWQKSGNNKVALGADKPRDHLNTLLTTPSNRLADLTENLVQSGQIATFNFQIKVPVQEGLYKEYFSPVVEGIQWMNNHSSFIQVRVGNSNKLITTGDEGEGNPESSINVSSNSSSSVTSTNSSTTLSGGSNINIASTKLNTIIKPRPIRIDLSYRGNPAVISANGSFSLYEGIKKLADFSKDQKVTVQYQDNLFKITLADRLWTVSSRPRFVPSNGTIMRIDNWSRLNTWGDQANNNEFRGILEALIYDNELHLINELPIEDYIKGIAEESASEPDEKIKTIMTLARTYARFYMDVAKKFPDAPFDLNDDPSVSQKYLGYSFEKRSAKTANLATATAGQYVTYQGKLIKTPYFSKSDGKKTISAKEKWGWTDTPFLNSVDDSFCSSTAFSGHGVGLSGCGATALAKLNKTSEEIIKYYYQGTEITQGVY